MYNLKSFSIPVPKNVLPKNCNKQIPSQIKKPGYTLCIIKPVILTSKLLPRAYRALSLHPNLSILWQLVRKVIGMLYFSKFKKKYLIYLNIPKTAPVPWPNKVSSLKKLVKTVLTRNDQQICNQHWITREIMRVTQFLSLIADL